MNGLNNIFSMQMEMFGWGVGSLALIWGLLLWGKPEMTEFMMLGVVAVVIVVYGFYWFSGSFYIGPRYWFTLFFPLLVLSSGGFEAVMARIELAGGSRDSAHVALALLCVFGLLVFTPWRGVEKYHSYNRFTTEIRDARQAGTFGNALVFFKIEADPGAALVLNDPRLPSGQPIFIRDLGPAANAAVMAAFPERSVMYFRDGAATPDG